MSEHVLERPPTGRAAPAHAAPAPSRRAAPPPAPELLAVASRRAPIEIGPADDPLELAADRVADRVVRRCACGGVAGPDGECARCKAARLAGRPVAPPVVHDALRTPGAPLDPATRGFFESRLGADLGAVRVHRDAAAADSARAVGAAAYTVGPDIVFGHGRYDPGGADGRRLLAHELAHVLQQRGGTALLQRQVIAPTCAGVAFDPAAQRCCDDVILAGAAPPGIVGCPNPTTRDIEYDGCSVPDWLVGAGEDRDNPGGAYDTRFSDPAIHGTQPRSFVPRLPCDVHDKCYQTCGANWEQCDAQLFAAARAVCQNSRQRPGSDPFERCMQAADKAETLLPWGSRGAFDQRQREYCACCTETRRAAAVIYFESASAELDAAAEIDVTAFVTANETLLTSPDHELAIIGHASRTGSQATNQSLTERRVATVRQAIEARMTGQLTNVVEAPFGEQLASAEGRPPADDREADRIVELVLIAR